MASQERKLLVVDDEEIIHMVLDRIFRDHGISLCHAFNSEEALKKLDESFGVVVTDIKMPGNDGIHFLQNIKKLHPTVQVIIMTGFKSSYVSTDVAKELGALELVMKPFSKEELVEIVLRGFEKWESAIGDANTNENASKRKAS